MRRNVSFGAVAIFLLAALYWFAEAAGGFFAWFLFYSCVVLLASSVATLFFSTPRLSVTRTLSSQRLSDGDTLEVVTEVSRRGWWPMFWLAVQDDMPQRWRWQSEGVGRIALPLWQRKIRFSYQVRGVTRGAYHLGDSVVETGDAFGFVKQKVIVRMDHTVVVYPRVAPVRGWTRRDAGRSGTEHSTLRRADESTDVIGVRSYVPGDRFGRIHWPVTARTGTLQAKEFERYVSNELILVPDLSLDSFEGESPDVFELEMALTASFLKYALDSHRTFGCMSAAEPIRGVQTGCDQSLFLRCMGELAQAQPMRPQRFGEMLVRIARESPRGASLVVVSPRLDKEAVVAASQVRRKLHLAWFVPKVQHAMHDSERLAAENLMAARVDVHFISSLDDLSRLSQGGTRVATASRR